jgi:hypothetical protein
VGVLELHRQPLGIQAQVLRELHHEGAAEDAPGQDVHSILLDRLEKADADLRGGRHVPKAHVPELALSAEVLAEGGHDRLGGSRGLAQKEQDDFQRAS